ncbi:MAG TPA: LPS export ABC transporter periplasmic protein LptC [Rhizomicrobium sp.]|jgi:lipopolysaccharide export system protein LptC|nr:LPS export ABC transporter periplasmic protein LptC [Rhizomicrobium sp.]
MARRTGVSEAVAQPISGGPAAATRTRRDWTARTRDTALNALRYSRFVMVMKRALPLAAGGLIAAVIVYALLPRQSDKLSLTYQSLGTINNDLTMTKPRLTGSDRKGNPFLITADAAVQDPANMRRATLRGVQADLTLDKGRWLNATAAGGFVDMDKGWLTLGGGIAIYSDDGYELHTARADVDLKKGLFQGPAQVTGHGPAGTLSADSFEVDRSTSQLVLVGHVRMTILPGEVHQ